MTDAKFPKPDRAAIDALRSGRYDAAITAFEASGDAAYLGMAHLLNGDEVTAQFVWMTPMMQGGGEAWNRHLADTLDAEASQHPDPQLAWLLRQHLREIDPDNLHNLLQLLQLSLKLHCWIDGDTLVGDTAELLQSQTNSSLSLGELEATCDRLLHQSTLRPGSLDFLQSAIVRFPDKDTWLTRLLSRAKTLETTGHNDDALQLGQLCLSLAPQYFPALLETSRFLQNRGRNRESLELLDRALTHAHSLPEKILATHAQLRGLLRSGGQWDRAREVYAQYRHHLETLFAQPDQLSLEAASRFIAAGALTAYFTDDLSGSRQLRNQIAAACQHRLQGQIAHRVHRYQQRRLSPHPPRLKIGYLSECFRQHSVGWLMRWLLRHHDRSQFEIHLYSLYHSGDALQQTFAASDAHFHELPYSALEVADKIHQDEIDILIDLDSITSNCGCCTLALKPAPIQVTWLGSDASGLPAVDYFLCDSYVLTDAASQHYQETLWRLPQTYIAVDGFEMGVPSLRRSDLDLPADAVVYFSSQTGYKRNPDDARRQLRILREVPNSYFLIKGLHTDVESVRRAFVELAEAEGVAGDRLRFLPLVDSELVHRANITIADVVLDTYPYNGTTTTLETLWAGVPVVSRVGEQFASRQGYTLLKNAGIEAGIAHTDDQYLEWGVRLGTDTEFRRQVSQQILANRRTAPLWNARAFTREVERAYQQMWERAIAQEATANPIR